MVSRVKARVLQSSFRLRRASGERRFVQYMNRVASPASPVVSCGNENKSHMERQDKQTKRISNLFGLKQSSPL